MRGFVSGKFCRLLRFLAGLSLRLLAYNKLVSCSDDTVPVLITAATLDSSLAAQTEHTSMPRTVLLSSALALYSKVLGSPLANKDHIPSVLLKNTRKKLADCKEELKDAKRERKVFLDNDKLLEVKNRYLLA